jgi:hypothetical protein
MTKDEYLSDLHEWMSETLGPEAASGLGAEGDNDWTLIVKLHAMIETALNTSLLEHFGLPELQHVIARLETSNMATGKVAFAKALKIIDKDSATFIQSCRSLGICACMIFVILLSTLRNTLKG